VEQEGISGGLVKSAGLFGLRFIGEGEEGKVRVRTERPRREKTPSSHYERKLKKKCEKKIHNPGGESKVVLMVSRRMRAARKNWKKRKDGRKEKVAIDRSRENLVLVGKKWKGEDQIRKEAGERTGIIERRKGHLGIEKKNGGGER